SIVAMLGVILYLRLGYVLGQAGLGQTLLIVIIAHVLTITTGLSLSTVATQRNIGAESAYFLICRSLGAPAGAAIGIPLFLAQALSISFYIVGFTESMALIWPQAWSNAGFVMPSKVISSVEIGRAHV